MFAPAMRVPLKITGIINTIYKSTRFSKVLLDAGYNLVINKIDVKFSTLLRGSELMLTSVTKNG